jgi:hypothetical protein
LVTGLALSDLASGEASGIEYEHAQLTGKPKSASNSQGTGFSPFIVYRYMFSLFFVCSFTVVYRSVVYRSVVYPVVYPVVYRSENDYEVRHSYENR